MNSPYFIILGEFFFLYSSNVCLNIPKSLRSSVVSFPLKKKSRKKAFSLHMHAKPSFAHRLQTAKIASSRTSAQKNGPRAQNNDPWV